MSTVPVVHQSGVPQIAQPYTATIMQAPPPAPVPEKELSIRDIFSILGRRKWTILFTTLFTIFFALLFTFSTKPSYVANATIQIEREGPQVVSFGQTEAQTTSIDSLQDPFFRTRYEMLKSRALAVKVIEQGNLENSLRTSGEPPEKLKPFFEFFALPDLGQYLDLGDDTEGGAGGAPKPKTDITTLFAEKLQVQAINDTHLVQIFFEGSSPLEAQKPLTVSSTTLFNYKLIPRVKPVNMRKSF